MNSVIMITQFFFTLVIGMYFFTKLRNEKSDSETLANNSKKEAEHLNCMRHIHLSEPVTETARPKNVNEIIGQDDGIRAIKAALCGPDPQHILIYGPAGVGKTAAARVALECAKKSNGTPFSKNAPILEPDIRKLEERFSQIYGSPKSLNDICLDSVILAPDMVKPVSSIEDEAKECNVYVLEEDWAANDDYGHDVDIFTDLNSAKISMLKQLKKEMKDGCIPDWKDDDDYIEETDENSFECYIDGYYSERHYSISIVEKPMKMSERFMAEISESMISQDMLSQFRTQVLKLKETELLSDAEYEQLLKDNSVAEVIKDKISGDDDFWDAYDSIISEVAREEVVKYTEKE